MFSQSLMGAIEIYGKYIRIGTKLLQSDFLDTGVFVGIILTEHSSSLVLSSNL